ncbi:hypothetical protein DBB42_15555 [Pseudomonas plecoglossicida]|uniref:Secreted protein n=1 Tax=Pseudomonas plecoglossicida TaxID=70775 RepID=A0A2R7UG34_PSEDL|nr:hypothetical protein DBB42_15555 [Pseudomonas plecoglossicida]
MSRKGRRAAPAICALVLISWGRSAALSRHKAAPTGGRARSERDQLRSRTQNNVAPATAAGIISTLTSGIISAR